ncbi:MAG: helix-hairpin-helix domain-containing protein, partial [Bacteroidetes bacterium]|nr:helix-hairpin-helix domain-containing protein [Bacteroidota bacterium]
MMRIIKYILGILLLADCNRLLGQEDINLDLENLFYESDLSEFAYDTYLENLEELQEKPLKINSADAFELEDCRLFSNEQISNILNYRELAGKLISIYELQAIPGFHPDFIHKILPYIQVNSNIDDYHIAFSKLISKGNYQLILRYQQVFPNKTGYQNAKYIGHPSKIYTRFKYNYSNKFSYGITAEKDPGEAMFKE